MSVTWPDEVDEILAGDAAAGFVYLTPAKGAVITPMAPLGQRDREAGTVTRQHLAGTVEEARAGARRTPRSRSPTTPASTASATGREFVLVQGRGQLPDRAAARVAGAVEPAWEKFLGTEEHGPDRPRWLEVYYCQRVPITIEVKRVLRLARRDLRRRARTSTASRCPPRRRRRSRRRTGTGPRVDAAKAAQAWLDALPHSLLAWAGADGLPMAVSVGVTGSDARRASGSTLPAIVPPGGRRAGLTSPPLRAHMVGQEQRIHTGWLEAAARVTASYAPHTKAGYKLPASKALFTFGAGVGTRAGIRKARERGLAPVRLAQAGLQEDLQLARSRAAQLGEAVRGVGQRDGAS